MKLTDLPENLKLVAVTKNHGLAEISSMLKRTGAKAVGENRLNEALVKLSLLDKSIEKHFIGKLQSRKIPKIVKLFDVIQTVENCEQAELISNQEKEIKVMIQVNISGLPQRSGCKPSETEWLIEKIQTLPHLILIGVMGIASHDAKKTRKEFKLLKSLQGDLQECSMGMSSDYEIAMEEGSTMLRLGRILFETEK